MSGTLGSPNLQNIDPNLPTSDKNASSHPAMQRRLTSDLPVSHHLTQREPSKIDDTCINDEAGDKCRAMAKAAQGSLQGKVD